MFTNVIDIKHSGDRLILGPATCSLGGCVLPYSKYYMNDHMFQSISQASQLLKVYDFITYQGPELQLILSSFVKYMYNSALTTRSSVMSEIQGNWIS